MRGLQFLASSLALVVVPAVHPQSVEVNRQNRTIEIIATEKVQVEADIANVTLGCVSYGQTHDQAYQANLKAADKVINALLGAGIQKTQIESNNVQLGEGTSDEDSNKSNTVQKNRQYKAIQTWRIRLPSAIAQKIVDVAVLAGANGIEYVAWDIADPEGLESRARVAAMEKARRTATEMVQANGGKLGDLLYASNAVSGILGLLTGQNTLNTTSASVSSRGSGLPTPLFTLQLFPEKIERQATVREIFAMD